MKEKAYITYSEIVSQGQTLRQILNRLGPSPLQDSNAEEVVLAGCGSSLFLSQLVALVWQQRLGISCRAVPASEVLLAPESCLNRRRKTIFFAVTRTGETSETNRAARLVGRDYGFPVIPVTCYPESPIAALEGPKCLFPEVREESVVMTRAFTGILGAFLQWADPEAEFPRIPEYIEQSLRNHEGGVQRLARQTFQNVIFLGTGPFYPIACEAMLKLKEMTGCLTEAWQSLEFRHGPKAVLTEDSLVWLFANREDAPYLADLVREVREMKAQLCLVGNAPPSSLSGAAHHIFANHWGLQRPESEALALLNLAHLYAYFRAVEMGRNPDQPAHLSRVVRL